MTTDSSFHKKILLSIHLHIFLFIHMHMYKKRKYGYMYSKTITILTKNIYPPFDIIKKQKGIEKLNLLWRGMPQLKEKLKLVNQENYLLGLVLKKIVVEGDVDRQLV